LTRLRRNRELVPLSLLDPIDKARPDSGRPYGTERKLVPPPIIEIADHGNAAGARRPDCEPRPGSPLMLAEVAAHRLVEPRMRAFVQQVEVVARQERYGSLSRLTGAAFGRQEPAPVM